MEEDGTGSTDLGFGVSWEHGSALRNSSPQLGQQLLPAREIHRNPAWAARGSRGRTQRDIPARGFLDAQQHEPRVSLRDRSRAVGPRCARCQPDTPVTRGSACKARLPARPGNGAASPGREMERERLKAEPEARDRGAARPHLSGCTAGPGAASPPAAPAPQGAAGGSSRRMFCSSRCLLQLPRPPPDEIRPRGISGGCKTPPLLGPAAPAGDGREGRGGPWVPSLALGWERTAGHPQTKGTGNGARRSERAPPDGRRAALFAASKGSRPQPARPLPRAAAFCAGAAIRGRIGSGGEGSDRTPLRREPPRRDPGGLRGRGCRLVPGASPRPSLLSSLPFAFPPSFPGGDLRPASPRRTPHRSHDSSGAAPPAQPAARRRARAGPPA